MGGFVSLNSKSAYSIRRAVDVYTAILFLGFAIFLIWLAEERYSDFKAMHQSAADKATQVAVREVQKIISDKRRVVDVFSKDNRDLVVSLAKNPDDDELRYELNGRIRRNIPDFFASNIMTSSGELVIGDFDGYVGDLCLLDMKHYIETGSQHIRVHPNIDTYHYDVLTRFPVDDTHLLFFVSFNTSELSGLLSAIQPSMHTLMLINRDMQNLIEITATGSRDSIPYRLDFRLTGDEKMRIMSSRKVDGTMWHIVDMHEPGLLRAFAKSIVTEYIVVYILLGIIAYYMRSVMVNEDNRRYQAEQALRDSNNEIKQLNEKLERMSVTDALTGLNNRRYLDDSLEKEWKICQRAACSICIALIDVDYFKKYNDHYGHQAGDECLIAIADLMMSVFRRAGDTVARYGGEEFIVVMTDISENDAVNILRDFQQRLEQLKLSHELSQVSNHVTVSIGACTIRPSISDTVEQAVKNADGALYTAKAGGRNKLVACKGAIQDE